MLTKKKKAAPVTVAPQPVKKKKVASVTVALQPVTAVKKKKAPVEDIPVLNIAPGHALLSPSYSKTWLACAAALAAGLDEPNVSGAAAIEGTLCHQVLENVINRLIDPDYKLDVKLPAWATIGPIEDDSETPKQPGSGRYQGQAAVDYINSCPLPEHPKMQFTADQAKLITPFIDYVRGLMDAGYTVFPEMRVELSEVLHPGLMAPVYDQDGNVTGEKLLRTFGTADLIAFKDDHLIVGDLKMGRHAVSPGTLDDLNTQMGLYGVGVLHRYRKTKDFKQVTLLIAQPRAGGLKFLEDIPVATLTDFAAFARDRAAAALACVSKGKKKLVAGDFNPTPGGCQWCRFRDKCSAKLKASTGIDEPAGNEISDEELFAAYEKLPLLESQIASTRAEVLKRLLAGRKIGGLKVVQGKPGNRKWGDERAAETYLLGKLFAKAYEKKILSPAAAAKLLPDDPELEKLIVRSEGKPSIAQGEDRREAYGKIEDSDLDD